MKERILELAAQAGYDARYCSEYFSPEEFAQLIVQECINTLEFHGFDDAVPYIKWMATNKLGVTE